MSTFVQELEELLSNREKRASEDAFLRGLSRGEFDQRIAWRPLLDAKDEAIRHLTKELESVRLQTARECVEIIRTSCQPLTDIREKYGVTE